jgi:hypothetical protein
LIALLLALCCAWTRSAGAQTVTPENDDHAVVFELGWAASWSRGENAHWRGGTFAFEVTPIEHWLEIEVGVSAIHADGVTEIPIDVLFKKPWSVSPEFEVMVGIGPELTHSTGSDSATYWGVSSVLDLMFWPKKNVGWYLEPGYEVTFRNGTEHGFALAAGLIIGR